MPATPASRSRAASGRPLRSPLAAPGGPGSSLPESDALTAPPSRVALTERGATRAEFEDYLRTTNNKFGRPYEEASISAYVCPAKVLLDVTGGGSARDFETARDHAIIRILCGEGIRRSEVLGMVMHTLPADLTRNPVFRVIPIKGARESGEGRLVSLSPSAARALAVYLRTRRQHKLAHSDWVWLGTRGRGRFANTGIRKMLVRRAEQAGYQGVTPHQFRHILSA